MTPAELTNEIVGAVGMYGSPPMDAAFPPPIALSAHIFLGNIQVR